MKMLRFANMMLAGLFVLMASRSALAMADTNKMTNKINTISMDEIDLNMRFTAAPSMLNSSNREFGYAVDFVVSDQYTLGPQISYFKYATRNFNVGAFGVGVNGTYSLNSNFKNGWFISHALKIYNYNSSSVSGGTLEGYVDLPERNINLSLMYGYKWFFSDGFNIRVSAGLQYNSDDNVAEEMYNANAGTYQRSTASMRGSLIDFDSDISFGLAF